MTKSGMYAGNYLAPYLENLKNFKVLSKEEEFNFFQRINEKEDDFILHLSSKHKIFHEALAQALKRLHHYDDEDSKVRFQRLLNEKKNVKRLFLKFCREDKQVRYLQEAIYSNIVIKYQAQTAPKINHDWFLELQIKHQELQDIRNKFANHNLRLVIFMAKKCAAFSESLQLTDLVQEGNLGLMEAIKKFDSSKECRFSTYASWWIKNYLHRSVYYKDKIVRLPLNIAENANKVKRFVALFLTQHGRNPSEKEISEGAGITRNLVNFILSNDNLSALCVYIDKPTGEDESYTFAESLVGDCVSAEDSIHQDELCADIDQAMNCLTTREAFVIKSRFDQNMTLQDIGDHCKISRERVRQIESAALKKLRSHPNIRRHSLFFN